MRREKTMDTLIRSIMIKSKRKMDAKVAQFELTTQQARVLGFLNDNAANEIIQKDLQRIFQTRGASITSLIQGLEKKELISRKPSIRDGREKVVTLTEEGKRIVDEFNESFPREDDKAKKILSADEYKIFIDLLSKIDDNTE
ncbi:MarR family transcriptional regulator [Listeria monocytogenes]|uniref:MarR family winged helix-turn-helix transcriptional regulator n=1 Tax=Listeria monocytogenes TaxID=1639 RepID=UPI00065FE415|nr:MarR family transcriptional regulator [Listeria monocytogenes]AKP38145.1 MarR family transcriptional regulator [Listeria monocytogenes]EAA0299097.1 MarR family transcriptional regulator [Listeria monocytogenes]EAC2649959.1 MarR family transcriptional regulator [Listeria monocytogenes]EAC2884134.1 MarR family transcriptional regulator [Listeria monocytogenes]EAC2914099.1 MarR family transcriptional regulator [Listeria monocytogenes]